MKSLFVLFLLGALAIRCLAQAPVKADADYAAFQILATENPPSSAETLGAEKYLTWLDAHRQALQSAARVFYFAYPTDPRRWELITAAIEAPPLFIQSFGPDVSTKGPAAIVPNERARAAWTRETQVWAESLLNSTDATPVLREQIEWESFGKDFRAMSAAKARGEPVDFNPFRARFDTHVTKYAQLDILADRASDYLGALERRMPGTSATIWLQLAKAPNHALREKATERLRYFDRMDKPLELSFTAVDGRLVDLAQWRGKVVLVDFWATWCGPCKEEIPNVKKVYSAYHDKGFEVIGIPLENAKLAPDDTAAQAGAKLAKTKQALVEFTAKEAMPWPQYFDGKWWKNDVAQAYSIDSIPAMFLLDRDGRVVSTNARGPKLESEVKRLLGI